MRCGPDFFPGHFVKFRPVFPQHAASTIGTKRIRHQRNIARPEWRRSSRRWQVRADHECRRVGGVNLFERSPHVEVDATEAGRFDAHASPRAVPRSAIPPSAQLSVRSTSHLDEDLARARPGLILSGFRGRLIRYLSEQIHFAHSNSASQMLVARDTPATSACVQRCKTFRCN